MSAQTTCPDCGQEIIRVHWPDDNRKTRVIAVEEDPEGNLVFTGGVSENLGVWRPVVRLDGTMPLFDAGYRHYSTHRCGAST